MERIVESFEEFTQKEKITPMTIWNDYFKDTLPKGSPYEVEYRLLHTDGSVTLKIKSGDFVGKVRFSSEKEMRKEGWDIYPLRKDQKY
jgi:hypothetical protein